jgi:hypothetical protein
MEVEKKEGMMKRFAAYMTARNIQIAWIIITLIALAAAAGAPACYGRGGG